LLGRKSRLCDGASFFPLLNFARADLRGDYILINRERLSWRQLFMNSFIAESFNKQLRLIKGNILLGMIANNILRKNSKIQKMFEN